MKYETTVYSCFVTPFTWLCDYIFDLLMMLAFTCTRVLTAIPTLFFTYLSVSCENEIIQATPTTAKNPSIISLLTGVLNSETYR